MRESILKDYFVGLIDESILREDLKGTVVQTSYDVFTYQIIQLEDEFEVNSSHLLKLCDAVLTEKLKADELEVIGFCLEASDYFVWDTNTESGNLIAETVFDWSSPEINFPLTMETVKKFRERLLTGKDTFTRDDVIKQPRAKVTTRNTQFR